MDHTASSCGRQPSVSSHNDSVRLLVHANVIHQHRLRETRQGVGTPWPVAPYGYVENQEERIIENPRGARRKVGRGRGLLKRIVDIEANGLGFPFDREKVEIVRKATLIRESVRTRDPIVA